MLLPAVASLPGATVHEVSIAPFACTYVVGHLRDPNATALARRANAVRAPVHRLNANDARPCTCVHTASTLEHTETIWTGHAPRALETWKHSTPEVVAALAEDAFAPRTLLLDDVPASPAMVPAPFRNLTYHNVRLHTLLAPLNRLRSLHNSSTCLSAEEANGARTLIVKTRPDVLIEEDKVRRAITIAVELTRAGSRRFLLGCGQMLSVAGVSDTFFVTTPHVLDELGSYDIVRCLEALRRNRTSGKWLDRCFQEWLDERGVRVLHMPLDHSIRRARSADNKVSCPYRAASSVYKLDNRNVNASRKTLAH